MGADRHATCAGAHGGGAAGRVGSVAIPGSGVPIAAMCTVLGFPYRSTIRRWRATNPEFAASFAFAQQEGWINLADQVRQEVDKTLERHGVAHARWLFSRRTHSLAQQAPAAFGRAARTPQGRCEDITRTPKQGFHTPMHLWCFFLQRVCITGPSSSRSHRLAQ